MDSWIWFVAGLFAGGMFGALVMACCCVAGWADRGRSIAPQREPGVLEQAINLLRDGLERIASTEKSQAFVTDGELAASYLAKADAILKAAPRREPGE